MRIRVTLAVVVVFAVACGGDGGADPGRGDYFTQVARVSETAHIQERGLRRDFGARLEHASRPVDRMGAVLVYVDQSTRLYRDVVDALRALDPPGDVASAHDAYIEAWAAQLDLIVKVRDAGFRLPLEFREALDAQVFDDAAIETRDRCEDLQSAVAADGSDVDLSCSGRRP
jgi:hypothetical protein